MSLYWTERGLLRLRSLSLTCIGIGTRPGDRAVPSTKRGSRIGLMTVAEALMVNGTVQILSLLEIPFYGGRARPKLKWLLVRWIAAGRCYLEWQSDDKSVMHVTCD